MDVIITYLNAWGKAFVDFSLPMLIQSSILIVILLLLDLILRKKVRAVFRYGIWMLVLVKLVLPTSLSAPTGLGYWLGDPLHKIALQKSSISIRSEADSLAAKPPLPAIPADSPMETSSPTSKMTTPAEESISKSVVTSLPAVPPLAWPAIVLLVWLVVVITMSLLLLQKYFFVRGLIAQARQADNTLLGILQDSGKRLGIRRKVALKLSANTTSPSVCGLVRPLILIPPDLSKQLNTQHIQAVLLHELAHIKRGDLWISFLQGLLQILYFYHPLFWLANAMIRQSREQAVDEMVLVSMGEEAENYPETLVHVFRMAFSRPTLSLRLLGVVESKSSLRRRIQHMVSRPFPRTAKLGAVGLLVVFVIAAVLLPMARAEKEELTDTPVTTQNTLDPMAEYLRMMKGSNEGKVVKEPAAPQKLTAELPNGVTVELVGFSDWYGKGHLQWSSPSGEQIQMPNVLEADVDDLGTVIALKLTSSDPASIKNACLIRLNEKENVILENIYPLDSNNLWFLSLSEPRRYINLMITCERVCPWQKSDRIPVNYKELFPSYPPFAVPQASVKINQNGIGVITGGSIESNSFSLHVQADTGYNLGYITAIDKAGNTYESTQKMKRSLIESIPAIGTVLTFTFPIEEFAGIVGETRRVPESKVVFKNLSLIPGQKSDVKIEIETPAKPDDPNEPLKVNTPPTVGNDAADISFGPVLEKVVNDDNEKHSMFINLDTGELITPPDELHQLNAQEQLKWFANRGIDAGGETNGDVQGLFCVDLVAIPVENDNWGTTSAMALTRDQVLQDSKPGTLAFMGVKGHFPSTYKFKTREGGIGILQITGFMKNPQGIKIRYKLIQNQTSQNSDVKIETPAQPGDLNEWAVSLPDDIRADYQARKASAKRRSKGGTSEGPQVSFECRILSIIDKKQVQNFLQKKEIIQENPPNLIISDQDIEHLTQLTKTHKKSGFLEGPHFTVFSGEEAEISFFGREKRPGFFLKVFPIVQEDKNRMYLSFEASEIRTDNSPPQTVALKTEMESGQTLLALTPPSFLQEYSQEKDSPDSTILLLIKPSIIRPNKEPSPQPVEIFQPF